MLSYKHHMLYFSIIMMLITGFNPYCFGEDKPYDSMSLEKITVTADKRKENIQEIPSAITAFSETDIEDAEIDNIKDLVDFVPNMFSGSTMQGYQEINFRGLSISQFTGKNPVVIFVDGIPQDHYSNYGADITNIERIEVLRGSQGTLYGKNAIGGVINIISKKPDNEFSTQITTEAGEHKTYSVKAVTNGPVIKDNLFFGLSGNYYKTDGFMKNDHPEGGYFDHEEALKFKSRLRWTPSEPLEINFHAGMTKRWDGSGVQIAANDEKPVYHAYKNPDDKSEPTISNTALNIDYKSKNFNLVSLTTYSDSETSGSMDQCYVKPSRPVALMDLDNYIFSQEVRIQSPDNKKGFKWLGGIYYANDELKYTNNAMRYKTEQMLGYDIKYNWADDVEEKTTAAFGQVTIPLFSRLSFTGGLRYEHVNKKMDYRYEVTREDTGAVLEQDPFMTGKATLVTYDIKDNWNALLPKGVVTWEVNKNSIVYTSVTKGYLAGGFNLCENIKEKTKFDEQSTIDYELGTKTSWFDNRLILNANIFYMDISDMHVYYAPDPVTYITSNAGEAHSQGVEMELKARPARGFDIMAGFGLVNAEYDKYTNTSGIDCSGKTLVRTPEYTLNLAMQYRHSTGFFSRFDLQGYGKSYFDDINTTSQKAYEVYNAKIGYEAENWDIYLYGKNIFDKEYLSFGRTNSIGLMATVGQPQTFGVIASIRF